MAHVNLGTALRFSVQDYLSISFVPRHVALLRGMMPSLTAFLTGHLPFLFDPCNFICVHTWFFFLPAFLTERVPLLITT